MGPEELEAWFAQVKRTLEAGYLAHDDPIRQSGFSGGAERWRRERSPVLEAIDADGDLLDVGCANGYLLECLVAWAAERGCRLVPYGVDISERFVALARHRLAEHADHFWVANAWTWQPRRRFRFVYALLDSVPGELMGEYARRLLDRCVEPGGRLIGGYYGSRSRGEPPIDVAALLTEHGMQVAGEASGGDPIVTRFAWVDKP